MNDDIVITPATRRYLAAFDEWLHKAWANPFTSALAEIELEQKKAKAFDEMVEDQEQYRTSGEKGVCAYCGKELPEFSTDKLHPRCKRLMSLDDEEILLYQTEKERAA